MRDRKKAFLKVTDDRHRPLHHGGDFIQQFFVDHCHPVELVCGLFHLTADCLAPTREVHDDFTLALEQHFVLGRCRDIDSLVEKKTMSAGVAPAFDTQYLVINDIVAEQQHDPVYRSHELRIQVRPTHALGNG